MCILFSFEILFIYLFILFIYLFFLLLIFCLGELVLITKGFCASTFCLAGWFTACFSTFNGNMLPLMTLVDLYKGGPASFQSNCQSGRRGRNCIQAMHSTLFLSLVVMTPPVSLVRELIWVLSCFVFFFCLFFLTRFCPSLSSFINTFYHYYFYYYYLFINYILSNLLFGKEK